MTYRRAAVELAAALILTLAALAALWALSGYSAAPMVD
jgi:hypothetical protein